MNLIDNLPKPMLLGLGVIFFLAKLITDTFFFIFDSFNSPSAIILRIAFSILIIFSFTLYIFKDFYKNSELPDKNSTDSYFIEIIKLIILSFIFTITISFIPKSLIKNTTIPNFSWLLIIEFISIYSIVLGLNLIHFIYKWLWIRRHKKTKSQLEILRWSIYLMIASEIPFQFYHFTASDIYNNSWLTYPLVSFQIIILILILLSVKRNSWIATLPRSKKWQLISFSALLFGISLSILIQYWDHEGEGKFANALMITFGSGSIIAWPAMINLAYCTRIFFSAIASLPTTHLVERQTNELSSLTYLNRLVAETIDFDNLIETVTKLALYSSGAIAAWTEITDKKDNHTLIYTQNLDKEIVESLYEDEKFKALISDIKISLYIESIPTQEKLGYYVLRSIKFAKSLIAIPLFAGEERLGTLVVLHPEEYGFESDHINVLTAFSHNVNVALENARLVEESIIKERYQKELMLAREIQEKLLPRNLLQVENYSIFAFSLPATEVGGDYYDSVKLKDGRTCVIIGDVSGKGMTAAFYMAQLKGVVLSVAKEATGAADILRRINSVLYGSMEKQMYITMTAIVFEDSRGTISIARAGHLPVILRNNNDTRLLIPHGIGVALTSNNLFDTALEEYTIALSERGGCLLITDGLTDLDNSEDFNIENLKLFFGNQLNEDARQIVMSLKQKIQSKIENNLIYDDITVMAIIYNEINTIS
jgi:phosphoserine phosphatase RsbU/P